MQTPNITSLLAETALEGTYDEIPSDARELAKRLIIDALACTVGGYHSPTGDSVRAFAMDLGGPAQATLIGSDRRVSCSAAILANEATLRYLDYNDDLPIPIGPGDLAAVHPSGALPVAFAVGELVGASGRQIIETMVAGYETMGRLLAGFATSLEVRGFHHGSVLSYAGAAMAGRLLGLSREQIAHAMGIAGSVAVGLDILDAEGEEYTMTKNIADGMMAERGYVAAGLAKRGFKGPDRIVEGHKGFAEVVLGGRAKFHWQPPRPGRPWILNTVIKGLCAEATTHGHLTATTTLVREHCLRPDDIAAITVRTNQRTVFHTGDPVKKYPRNKETADHSSYFLTAMAVLNGEITPRIYSDTNYKSSEVRRLIELVTLEHGPEFDAIIPAAQVTIRLKNGRQLVRRVDKSDLAGEPTNRMSDSRLRAKFNQCADGVLSPARLDDIIDLCLKLESEPNLSRLLELIRLEHVGGA